MAPKALGSIYQQILNTFDLFDIGVTIARLLCGGPIVESSKHSSDLRGDAREKGGGARSDLQVVG